MNERAAIELLGATSAPYLLIDPVAARLEEANDEGRAILGIPLPATLPAALDSAMPAIVRLRQILNGECAADRETLTFWSTGKLTNFICSVTQINREGRQMMLLTAGATPSAWSTTTASAAGQPGHSTGQPLTTRDDKETLKEIARRIREGQLEIRKQAVTQLAASDPPELIASSQAQTHQPTREAPTSGANPVELAKLAHELKTPLSAIVAASEIMRDERLGAMGNDRYLDYASDIHESAKHGLAVINAMLKDAAIAAGPARSPIDLNGIVASTVSSMQPLAHASHLTIERLMSEDRLEVHADATAVRQMLTNLLTNAIKFTPPGGGIHVVTGYLENGSVYFVVRDTGTGMEEDKLARAFYEDDDGKIELRRGGGYGLGLPMVRRLAEANGATIEIDTAPSKGTVILVSFPRRF